jgi:glycine dehydrogenase subunit 1
VATDLESEGYAVHVVGEHRLQVCVTDANAHAVDGFVAAMAEVA